MTMPVSLDPQPDFSCFPTQPAGSPILGGCYEDGAPSPLSSQLMDMLFHWKGSATSMSYPL
jgi:hypothetical protein